MIECTLTSLLWPIFSRSIVTHGFVLDEKGHKMSKSLGNVITPSDVLTGRFPKKGARGQPQKRGTEKSEAASVGADVLRWWVASCDFTTDCAFGVTALATTTEHVRKLRNTLRFVLSALHGYQSGTSTVELQDSESEILRKRQLDQLDALAAAWSAPVPKLLQGVELERLTLLDRAMLQRLATFNDDVSRSLDSLVSGGRRYDVAQQDILYTYPHSRAVIHACCATCQRM